MLPVGVTALAPCAEWLLQSNAAPERRNDGTMERLHIVGSRIVRNSWGSSWGEQGHMRLEVGSNQCGIRQGASAPCVCKGCKTDTCSAKPPPLPPTAPPIPCPPPPTSNQLCTKFGDKSKTCACPLADAVCCVRFELVVDHHSRISQLHPSRTLMRRVTCSASCPCSSDID